MPYSDASKQRTSWAGSNPLSTFHVIELVRVYCEFRQQFNELACLANDSLVVQSSRSQHNAEGLRIVTSTALIAKSRRPSEFRTDYNDGSVQQIMSFQILGWEARALSNSLISPCWINYPCL